MALGPRLDLRQSQSLVMTPQLQQAIKLLALSNLEIETFIGEALDANPLLDVGEAAPAAPEAVEPPEEARRTTLESSPVDQLIGEGRAADDRPLDIDATALDRDRDTGDGGGDFTADWGRELGGGGGEAGPGIDERGGLEQVLGRRLPDQLDRPGHREPGVDDPEPRRGDPAQPACRYRWAHDSHAHRFRHRLPGDCRRRPRRSGHSAGAGPQNPQLQCVPCRGRPEGRAHRSLASGV